jgi:hypothetical protein
MANQFLDKTGAQTAALMAKNAGRKGEKRKAPRADFALAGGKFPLNTPGRVAAAPGLAAYSRAKGNITAAQEATVDRKAAAKRR